MKKLIKSLLVVCLLASVTIAKELSTDIEVFTSKNRDSKITPKTIEEAFKKAGFFISANRDMNAPFIKQFKESDFQIYNLFTFYKKDIVLELAKKYPNIGLFAPMSMSIYSKKGSEDISVAILSAKAMARIMKIKDDDETLNRLNRLVVDTIKKSMPKGKFVKLSYNRKKPQGELLTTFSMEMDKDEWEEELEDFKMAFEGELATNGFIIAGENNLGDDFDDMNYTGYDFYEVYSICKLPVIYTIAKNHPEAGAFAPCSLYLEKKKDENIMNIGFPSVYNWISSMALSDKKDIEVLKDAQSRMTKILKSATE